MGKDIWKPGTVIYPVPAVMVSCGTMEQKNIITVAWTGTVNSDPAMTYVSVRAAIPTISSRKRANLSSIWLRNG